MTLIKFFEGKSKNRRVNLYAVKQPDGTVFFHVKTKRLIDFKKREITSTDHLYSYETFRSIIEMGVALFSNSEFNEQCKKHIDEMKNDQMRVKTNNFLSDEKNS